MKLIIQDQPYDIFESLSGSSLGVLRELQKATKERGTEISLRRIREYLLDVLKNTIPFGHVDTDEKLLCMQALVWLCWQHAGVDHVFDDTLALPLNTLEVRLEDGDIETAPKEQTDSVPGDDAEPTT